MERIALTFLLDNDLALPDECHHCPFADVDPDEESPNPADPGEGMYLCALLGNEEIRNRNNNKRCWTFGKRSVWGERPLCRPADWTERAKSELSPI